ncbi:hypothetical protein, partial [Enterobacter cloacae]|uniref:hypothetical protein n=1 Tax=Enterobacter cloacae TaxID=550 RepID=UPI001144499D
MLLIHFDTASNTARKAFPIFKPPTDSAAWSATDRAELHRQRGIEFQDEYPLLVASLSSLTSVRSALSLASPATSADSALSSLLFMRGDSFWATPC